MHGRVCRLGKGHAPLSGAILSGSSRGVICFFLPGHSVAAAKKSSSNSGVSEKSMSPSFNALIFAQSVFDFDGVFIIYKRILVSINILSDSGVIGVFPGKIFEFASASICLEFQALLLSGRVNFIIINKRHQHLRFPNRDEITHGYDFPIFVQGFYRPVHI